MDNFFEVEYKKIKTKIKTQLKSCWSFTWPNWLIIQCVKNEISIVLHDEIVANLFVIGSCAPNRVFYSHDSVVVNNNISIILINENWIYTVFPDSIRCPESISRYEMFRSVNHKIAISLHNSIISIGWLNKLIDSEIFSTFEVRFSLTSEDCQRKKEKNDRRCYEFHWK